MHILSIDRNKSPLQISGKVAGCIVRTLKLLRAPTYWAHRAVVFAIARLSCFLRHGVYAIILFILKYVNAQTVQNKSDTHYPYERPVQTARSKG